MHWYHYFSGFLAGMFLSNFVPHFVKGVCGDPFPTPFSNPHGRGLSTPIVNVLWALFNLTAGFLLFRFGKVAADDNLSVLICFIGFICISVMSAMNFVHKDKA
ncbi:hypothetical protein [Mucilaginibacter paludis]|uniref:Uncharacterized protein n=1 Tax=Mucilaginibacter paludis DSM 18603 TaxID=714943 RepID=H1Y133_9SPHI|nr:hypothetical protein [Mucilaginibacter paludis]EHQ29668.1 hypothetical protein Mucpa_5599 [Mucilaginibacter paludis DSM 18603]